MGQNLKNMKTILYIGATLMIGASIYRFVDYKKTSPNKEFTKMYDSKETIQPVINNENLLTGQAGIKKVVTKPETKNNEKVAVIKKESLKKNEVAEEKTVTKMPMKPMETIIAEKAATNIVLKENTAVETDKPVKKEKKLSYKLFSRAPLEEKYIDKELKLKPKKTQNKEQ